MVERAARLYGDKIAIDFFENGTALSFNALHDQVCRLSGGLAQIGVQKGTHVLVLMSNRIEFPLAWLALARLGAVMVPAIASLTEKELRFIVEDADVDFLIAEASLLADKGIAVSDLGLRPLSKTIIVGDETSAAHVFEAVLASGDPDFVPLSPPKRSDLLNIQYTSGTTGLPKGVMQSHRYWIICGPAFSEALDNRFTTVLADHPFFYMDPQWMLLFGLYSGARVDFTNGLSLRKYIGWLADRKTEFTWLADPILKSGPNPLEKETTVKLFLGYNLTPTMIKEAEGRFGARVREAYGMTEIGSGLQVPFDFGDPDIIGTAGLPAHFRTCRIVRADGTEAAVDEPGELWVRGDGLFDGYYNRPDANKEVIIDGWFLTGDLATKNAKGYFKLVGRLKDMVKRSGENISCNEVEQVLVDMPEIFAAAVVSVPDPHRDEEVKAYVQLNEGLHPEDVPPQVILAHCAERLAKFKLPRYVEYVTQFSYTSSDKIAKRELTAASDDLRVGAFDLLDNIRR
ncbi:hypothetical protein ABENE_20435 [Asticcacaulis benevestitus DSM 16100 = ATCC BAA-896]|uniref:AMP-dependent synthetase/ligase domain-containing protein n=1 Tax=Asticcacaulis benevestitus DSM 16100 = ATCC BAA-896 TaxID=1121022 RepID=V4NN25_9CAUL|nr:hypothetical protein ABENE_20435 [Asticcacaulis benevestitus DSM 16100 = ATCC BAA-896]